MNRKKTAAFCSLLLAASVALGTAHALPLLAKADETPELKPTQNNASLFLPGSYEEYLPLTAPAYMAMSERYIVIADGAGLYILDRAASSPQYLYYDSGLETKITKVQLTVDPASGKERLFFATSGYLYEYNFTDNTHATTVACHNFLIVNGYLYSVRGSVNTFSLYSSPLSAPGNDKLIMREYVTTIVPNLSAENGNLYYVLNNDLVLVYDLTQSPAPAMAASQTFLHVNGNVSVQVPDLQFVCAHHGYLYYTVNGASESYENGLYRTDLNGNIANFNGEEKPLIAGDGFTAVDAYGDNLYYIRNAAIHEVNVTSEGVFQTGYEITASSSSPNRLNGAGEMRRAGSIIATVDTGNNRVVVYDEVQSAYSVIDCDYIPYHVAVDKDGKKIAVSSEDKICVYEAGKNGYEFCYYNNVASAKGIAFVYDECYYVTEHGYGYLNPDSTPHTAFAASFVHLTNITALSSNVFGDLYVAADEGVYRFTEAQLRGEEAAGTQLMVPVSTVSDFSVDYLGNVWYLSGNKLYNGNNEEATIDGNNFVYHTGATPAAPVSFAFGFDSDVVYFNFGNYAVKTGDGALNAIQTLNKIPAQTAAEQTFALHSEALFASVQENAVAIQVDLNALKGENVTCFPYAGSYYRTPAKRGVLLAQTDDYYLLALPEGESFVASIFRRSDGMVTVASDGMQEASGVAYIANAVALTYAPCTAPALSSMRLERGVKLNVLGYATGEDREYAYVEIASEGRDATRGYVPRSYLTSTNPLGVPVEEYTMGHIKGDKNVVLYDPDGLKLEIYQKTPAKIVDNGDGTFTVTVEHGGKTYSGVVEGDAIARGETDALRISLIVILSVLALVIIGAYVFLMFPRKRKQ